MQALRQPVAAPAPSRLDDPAALADIARRVRPLPPGEAEIAHARTAWAWFTHHTSASGFGPASDNDPSLSPWEMGSTLYAITSAERLRLIAPKVAARHLATCLDGLARLKIGTDSLPGLAYHHATLKPLVGNGGVSGWSAGGIMRLVAGFIAVATHFPNLGESLAAILNHWRLDHLLEDGRFRSARPGKEDRTTHADLFLGAEQYAARTASLIKLPASNARDPRPVLRHQDWRGLPQPGDRRQGGAAPPVTSPEPFLLDALEYGWQAEMLEIAASIAVAEKARYMQTGRLTALADDPLDRAPGFACSGILAGCASFATRSRDGTSPAGPPCLSAKAAFAWWALLPTPYARKRLDAVEGLATKRGWLAGIHEDSLQANRVLSLNTNAMILEALHYRALGPFVPLAPPPQT